MTFFQKIKNFLESAINLFTSFFTKKSRQDGLSCSANTSEVPFPKESDIPVQHRSKTFIPSDQARTVDPQQAKRQRNKEFAAKIQKWQQRTKNKK